MYCRKVKQLFFPWLDEELPEKDVRALNKHLAECDLCAGEAFQLKAISAALQKMNEPVTPPEGFRVQVISRLQAELTDGQTGVSTGQAAGMEVAGRWRRGLDTGWKRGVATAAAFVLLLGGSAGIAARYVGTPGVLKPPALVAEKDPANRIASNQSGSGSVIPPVQPPVETQKSPENSGPGENGGNRRQGSSSVSQSIPGPLQQSAQKPGSNTTPQRVTATAEPKIFLNQSRTIESLLWKVNVMDLDAATGQLMTGAKVKGISYSVGHEIQLDNGRMVNIFRFEVPQPVADQFAGIIVGLGQVVSRDRNVRDISGEFTEKLDRYHGLLAERKIADGQQAKQLDTEIKRVGAELTAMDKEAREQLVFIVWLES
jgi:hypothetical protein